MVIYLKSIKPHQLSELHKRQYHCKYCPKGYPNLYIKLHHSQKMCIECMRMKGIYQEFKKTI